MAVGLAAAEGRADLATLGAVGADPRRRRRIAMAQAGVVGGLGCLLGLLLGTFIATLAHGGLLTRVWVVPWTLIGLAVVGVPMVAMLVAGTFTRSRLPMVRRIAA
jgi:putative ABC transport system permease protein